MIVNTQYLYYDSSWGRWEYMCKFIIASGRTLRKHSQYYTISLSKYKMIVNTQNLYYDTSWGRWEYMCKLIIASGRTLKKHSQYYTISLSKYKVIVNTQNLYYDTSWDRHLWMPKKKSRSQELKIYIMTHLGTGIFECQKRNHVAKNLSIGGCIKNLIPILFFSLCYIIFLLE